MGEKVYFKNLDGIRTLAFLMVFLQHGFTHTYELLHIKNDVVNRVFQIASSGGTGVSLFFVLSGFLITYLLLQEVKQTGKINVLHFYLRRMLRIWPLYYAVVIFAFVLYPFLKSQIGIISTYGSNPIYYYTFLSNFDVINIQKNFPGQDSMSGGITWSVAIEEQFYLLWPLLFIIIPKHKYLFIFLFTFFISLIFRLINFDDGVVVYFHSLSACTDLSIGGYFAYLVSTNNRIKSIFQNLSFKKSIIFYIIFLLFIYFDDVPSSDNKGLVIFNRVISPIFFAIFICEQSFSSTKLFAFSDFKFLSFWGKYTYGLYLLHPIAITFCDIVARVLKIDYKNSFQISIFIAISSLILSFLIAYISYEYFEKFFLQLKNRFVVVHSKSSNS